MKAMLFAAGLGTRLRPLTDTLPKCLVPVNGRPMIDYPLLLLRHYGTREIVVNVHHHAERVEEHLGDGSRFGVDIVYSREPVLLDTGGGLLGAKRFLEQDTFVIMNSDVLIDLRLDEVLRFHRDRGAAATLVLRKDPRAEAYGAIWTDAKGEIRRLLHHEARGEDSGALEQYMFTGVHIVEPRIFRYMEGPETVQHHSHDLSANACRGRAPLRFSLRRRLAGHGHPGTVGGYRGEAAGGHPKAPFSLASFPYPCPAYCPDTRCGSEPAPRRRVPCQRGAAAVHPTE